MGFMRKISALFALVSLLAFAAPLWAQEPEAASQEVSAAAAAKPEPPKAAPKKNGKTEPVTYTQLRTLIMNFADHYNQMVGQAADGLQKANDDPDMRAGIHSMKLFPCSAAFSIAIDPNPQLALLDMGILVYLQGSVWRDNLPKRYGEKAAGMIAAQDELEAAYGEIALRVLGADKLGELKALAQDWRRAHPDQRYVSYIRLSDFSDAGRQQWPGKGPNFLSIGGLLSVFQLVNMDETTRSVDEARMLGERGLYLAQRMPNLLRWQTQMLMYEMSATPETKSVMGAATAVREWPAVMARERQSAIEQLSHEAKELVWECVKGALVVILAIFALLFVWRATRKH